MKTRSAELARSITRASSVQSYVTARLMVDKNLESDCFRAYGYFRWVDDMVDINCQNKAERLAFINRQKNLFERLYRAETCPELTPQEEILADLIRNDQGKYDRLKSYIHNFLAIIEFDANRKGRRISNLELEWYANTLAKAVTDGIQYFVCNGYPYPESENRYLAAVGAHIAHMLRDMVDDIQAGYFNFPKERIQINQDDVSQFYKPEIREWVKSRVQRAQMCFVEGKKYLDELTVLRCRIVGYWYCARFENILANIEKDGYVLRADYKKPGKLITWLKFAGIALAQTWQHAFQHFRMGSPFCGWSQNTHNNPYEVITD